MLECLIEVSGLKWKMPRRGISSPRRGRVIQVWVWWLYAPRVSRKTLEFCSMQRVTGYRPFRITTSQQLIYCLIVVSIPGQIPSRTVPIPDNSHQVDSSHPGQFPSRTVPIPDNSHRTIPIPDSSHPGQFPPDNSHPGYVPSRTIPTGQFPSRTVPIPDNSHPLNSQPSHN